MQPELERILIRIENKINVNHVILQLIRSSQLGNKPLDTEVIINKFNKLCEPPLKPIPDLINHEKSIKTEEALKNIRKKLSKEELLNATPEEKEELLNWIKEQVDHNW